MATGLRPLPTGVAKESNIESVKQGLIAVNVTRTRHYNTRLPRSISRNENRQSHGICPVSYRILLVLKL